ncbi:PQ-loop-domain-containing protein [Rickenella mellea]|uniref:PQ-loop-domain-containing protein n=1 Tax=Rickenella mellea TaxID=50990 RepID=A0A4Y7Q7V7_9AGAM|nr:PQ-loop-domain-containing protein [Rickenella mellea]
MGLGNGDLSSALGWVSIACWIVVYTPQIYENYKLKSGEGLSVFFVVIWLLGDLCNLAGAVMAGLLPTMIILAIYYTLCDIILLVQIYYYRYTHPVRIVAVPGVTVSNEAGEESPLLAGRGSDGSGKAKHESSRTTQVLLYSLALGFVIATGVVAWRASMNDRPDTGLPQEKDIIEWRSQLIGWTSALLYLGSRIPQIFKNFTTKCEGLSLALFMFAIAGNAAYVLSICTDSMEAQHLIANASWIAGSGLTILLDIFVLGQFFYFRSSERSFVEIDESVLDA